MLGSAVPHASEVRSSPGVKGRRTSESGRQCSTSLQGRCADPARAPNNLSIGGQTLLRVQRSDGETGPTPANSVVPGVGFEPTSPRLQRGAFTRLASQAMSNWCGRRESNPCLCVVAQHAFGMTATYGSAIQLRTLISRNGAQSRTRTCEARRHLIYSQGSLPLEYLCGFGRGGRTRTCVLRVMSPASCCCSTPRDVGGRLTVRTPHL
jgi:hypothetical protein